jgi:hypothetical protein
VVNVNVVNVDQNTNLTKVITERVGIALDNYNVKSQSFATRSANGKPIANAAIIFIEKGVYKGDCSFFLKFLRKW